MEQKYAFCYTSKNPISEHIGFTEMMERLKNGHYKEYVLKAREKLKEGKAAYDSHREDKTPAFLPEVLIPLWRMKGAGNFTEKDYTGHIVFDIDDKSQDQERNKKILQRIPWIIAVGTSIGGTGLFAIAKAELGKREESFAAAISILQNEYGIIAQSGQGNVNRLRYVTWDPDLSYNDDIELADTIPLSNSTKSLLNNSTNHVNTPEFVRRCIDIGCTPDMSYDNGLMAAIGRITRAGCSFDDLAAESAYMCRYMHPKSAHNTPEALRGIIFHCSHNKSFVEGASVNSNGTLEYVSDEVSISNPEFIPDWNNKPAYIPPVLKLSGISILTFQNISTITAAPGSGKTSCIEAIAASFLNSQADCLGFEVDRTCKGVLIIDTERTKTDVWNSFYRMCRRAGINEGDPIGNVRIVGMRGISDPENRKKIILKHLDSKAFNLFLLDGIGDILRDTNNIEQSKAALDWLRSLTDQYEISIVATIHPNPGSEKARGNAGGELLRDSETVLIIKEFEGAKILTSDFAHGKNRNTAKLTTGFKWSDEKMMFISVDHSALAENRKSAISDHKRAEVQKVVQKLIPAPTSKTFTDLVGAIKKYYTIKDRQAKQKIKDWCDWELLSKQDEYYYLKV